MHHSEPAIFLGMSWARLALMHHGGSVTDHGVTESDSGTGV